MMATSLLLGLSACQPEPAEPEIADSNQPAVAPTPTQPTEQEAVPELQEPTLPDAEPNVDNDGDTDVDVDVNNDTDTNANKDSTPQVTAPPAPSSVAAAAKNQQLCTSVRKTIAAVNSKSKMAEITAVQELLRDCLPAADNASVLQWLAAYQAMYERFLALPNTDTSNQENFYTVMDKAASGKIVPEALLKTMSPRAQYLIGLVEQGADVSVQYLGEGDFHFHHDLTAMAKLFTPYLRKDQAAFIQRMARDNQGIFWNDAAIAVPFNELINRALFWESYSQRYPDGYATRDAKRLFNIYRYVLFFGSENTQWTDDAIREFDNLAQAQAMQQLAKRSNSVLAKDAQKFLEFMTLADSERELKYPHSSSDIADNMQREGQLAKQQLRDALQILSPWTVEDNRNCLEGVVCTTYKLE
jgi:hypothetical protein